MSDKQAPMSERLEAVASLVGKFGYRVLHQVGGEDGDDWEVSFHMGALLTGRQSPLHHCFGKSERELLHWLTRKLPEVAAHDWRQYALELEAELARRGR